jgi:hypothetical protein
MIDFCLYADPNDMPTHLMVSIITNQFSPIAICSTFEEVENTLSKSKRCAVLVVPPRSNEIWNHDTEKKWLDEIQILTSKNIQIVFFADEVNVLRMHFSVLSKMPNLLMVIPAQNTFGMKSYPWVIWQHWLQDAATVYRTPRFTSYINTLEIGQTRPKLFDVLLGGQRPYRTMLHDWIEQDPLLESKTIMTYFGLNSNRPFIPEPDLDVPIPAVNFHTGVNCEYLDVVTRVAVIPPISIYQQCAYTVVAETTAQDNYVFFTEKIARPIICQRLFIVLSSHKYLHYLRESGFQTFGDIINESYDLEVDDKKRWRMAFEQMQNLASMDQQLVLNQIDPIVKHNKKILLETDWNKKMSRQVNQIITARINRLAGI